MTDTTVALKTRMGDPVILHPAYGDTFSGPFVVTFTRAKAGVVDGMLMSTARTRGVRFDKVKRPGASLTPAPRPTCAPNPPATQALRSPGSSASRRAAVSSPGTPLPTTFDCSSPRRLESCFERKVSKLTDIVHVFTDRTATLKTELDALRTSIRSDAAIWVSWPKKASRVPTDITEDTIRELALPLGLVDVKVCAVNDVWSGLKLVIRKELR